MKTTSVFAGLLAVLVFCGAASADIIPPSDPDMSMDAGSFSTPLSQFVSFTPSQTTGGGILDLFNDTGHLLTSFSLTTFINKNLTDAQIAGFHCDSADNPFFLQCSVTYDPVTGELTMSFFGVHPADGDERFDDEVGEHEGIPSLRPGCTDATADSPYCKGQGHFAISFNNDFSFTGNTGGWDPSASPDLFSTAPTFSLTPEPSAVLLFGTVLSAIAGVLWKARRRTAVSSTADRSS